MKRMTKLFSMLVVVSMLLTLTGSVAFAKEKLVVDFFVTEDNHRQVSEFIKSVLAERLPEYDVEFRITEGDAETAETKIRTQMAAGGCDVDVWWCHGGTYADPLINGGYVLPLNEYLDAYREYMTDGTKAFLDAQEQVYAIPFETSTVWCMYVNMGILNKVGVTEIPKDYASFKEVCQKVLDGGYIPIVTGAADGWMGACWVESLAYTVTASDTYDIVNFNGKTFSESEAYKAAVDATKELIDLGYFQKNIALIDRTEANSKFQAGEAAFFADGTNFISMMNEAIGDDLAVMFYPMLNGDVENYAASLMGGLKANCGFMVNANSKNKEAAVKLAVTLAMLKNEYEYTYQGAFALPWDAEKLGWKAETELCKAALDVQDAIANAKWCKNYLVDSMPSSAGLSYVFDYSTRLFSDSGYTTDSYLADLDTAVTTD